MSVKPLSNQTKCVTLRIGTDKTHNAVIPPIYLSSTYKFTGLDEIGKYDYGRGGNPNRDDLAQTLAELEGGTGGVITSSGMAAIDLVLNLVKPGETVIAPHDCYGGTYRLLLAREKQGRFVLKFVDQSDSTALTACFKAKPALILIETPSNPLMRLVDIQAIADAGHKVGALVVCDNTFLSPARQKPFTLGADFVVHSATKYLNGHSDVVGGAALAKNPDHVEELIWWANCSGVTGAPFDSYLILRGLRTLHARIDVQEANALKIAKFLASQPLVSQVYYPGLETDPGYDLARKQQSGPGAMLSFEIDADREGVGRFLAGTNLFQMAESLGGTESLICHPASMTHRAMDEAALKQAGITERLLRLSVGLEHVDDLLSELKTLFAELN